MENTKLFKMVLGAVVALGLVAPQAMMAAAKAKTGSKKKAVVTADQETKKKAAAAHEERHTNDAVALADVLGLTQPMMDPNAPTAAKDFEQLKQHSAIALAAAGNQLIPTSAGDWRKIIRQASTAGMIFLPQSGWTTLGGFRTVAQTMFLASKLNYNKTKLITICKYALNERLKAEFNQLLPVFCRLVRNPVQQKPAHIEQAEAKKVIADILKILNNDGVDALIHCLKQDIFPRFEVLHQDDKEVLTQLSKKHTNGTLLNKDDLGMLREIKATKTGLERLVRGIVMLGMIDKVDDSLTAKGKWTSVIKSVRPALVFALLANGLRSLVGTGPGVLTAKGLAAAIGSTAVATVGAGALQIMPSLIGGEFGKNFQAALEAPTGIIEGGANLGNSFLDELLG